MPAKTPTITDILANRLQALGVAVRQQRKHLGVNMTVAADAAGMSRVTWHRIEKGEPSVTMGAYLNALSVLGLDFTLKPEHQDNDTGEDGWIPVHIQLADYPQLQQLAWHIHDTDTLTPREALDIYERHQRHLDMAAMTQAEKDLLAALRQALTGKDDAI